ncbi:MAG: response regulator [Deltaproteobacteria bacterium]|nr:response regulator [Deltaproteobacteria bacterium]
MNDAYVDPDLLDTFLGEARSHLEVLQDPTCGAEARRRAIHGLRGASSIVGAMDIMGPATALEGLPETGEDYGALVNEIAQGIDAVARQGVRHRDPGSSSEDRPKAEEERTIATDAWDPETTALLRDLFRQEAEEHIDVITTRLLDIGEDPSAVEEVLRRAHTLKGSAGTVGYACTQRAAHQLEERLVRLRDGEVSLGEGALDRLLEACDLLGPMTWASTLEEAETILSRFSAGLAAVDNAASVSVDGTLGASGGGSVAERSASVSSAASSSLSPGAEGRRSRERRVEDLHVIRVDVDRLDDLMNAVGQLVIDRTRVDRRVQELRVLTRDLAATRQALFSAVAGLAGVYDEPTVARLAGIDADLGIVSATLERSATGLADDSEGLRRTTRQLQEELTRVRMMSIRWLFARLSRPLRELSGSEGKRVELRTSGESTELDRSVIEKITDPLIHLLRNAVAHGIETPERRREAGKPEVGTIRVSARHQGEFIFIEVEDDGAGIDPRTLRAALTRWGGLDVDPERLSDAEAVDAVFLSGFSTRSEADALAGRGVGLDVVRRNVSSLGGDIQVSSIVGQGTRFVIRLPLTMAIAQALLFRLDDAVYAIPVAHVVETRVVRADEMRHDEEGASYLHYRDQWIPILWLRDLFGGEVLDGKTPKPDRPAMVVLSFGRGEFALACSEVLGPREIVLKSLGPILSRIPLFAGATISGAGDVQLVLDVAALDELVSRSTKTHRRLALPPPPEEKVPERRILVVDDSLAIREAVRSILRSAGYVVDTVSDGLEAWERLERYPYIMLLTDLEMPRVHGYELIDRCREDQDQATLPIIVLSSRTAEKNRQAVLDAGADAFLAKPVNRRVLLATVTDLLRDA